MTKAEYLWPIPRLLGHEWRAFRRSAGPAGDERGQAQRYFLERREAGDALEQLRVHHRAPVESCACYVCNGGAKLAFRMSGATMPKPIQEAIQDCAGAARVFLILDPYNTSDLGRDVRSKETW